MNKILYKFIGIHSIIMGLFTFFIPILLINKGLDTWYITLFISITGLSFIIGLYLWDNLRFKYGIKPLIVISFILEIVLIYLGGIDKSMIFLFLFPIVYGIYNCFFWITNRILFLSSTKKNNIGNKFGNIQIIGFLLVKVGIIIGSFFLENNYYNYLFITATILSLYGIWYFSNHKELENKMSYFSKQKKLNIRKILGFKDKLMSKRIFILDGPFLFFESFFWIISLYFITDHSYTNLGFLVVFLALTFSLIFYGIKKKIDKYSGQNLYYLAVLLYLISWGLRGYISDGENNYITYISILLIAFFTLFFRLVFNKQFFNNAKLSNEHEYIIIKSYYSQFSIFITFGIIAIILGLTEITVQILLSYLYYIIAPFSLIFILYKPLTANK